MIAGELRNRILDGELADGEMLPRQEELLESFNVSPPSLRGALQILETEGLITVLRGSVGGAIVHTPQARGVAYNVGLVLQANQVDLQDVATAREHLEALCVSLCAARPDRNTEVVPVLWRLQNEINESIDDFDRVTEVALQFHEELVGRCGNRTLILLVGALEKVWTAHEHEWVSAMSRDGREPSNAERIGFATMHEQIIVAIADGDVERAGRLAAEHVRRSETPLIAPHDARVDASLVQSPFGDPSGRNANVPAGSARSAGAARRG
jgi:DNA-binding FadR family transcriptional regulator